jgi:glyoxylase-like metal-dependent hydrolase (beta-lactamase superfamily II)
MKTVVSTLVLGLTFSLGLGGCVMVHVKETPDASTPNTGAGLQSRADAPLPAPAPQQAAQTAPLPANQRAFAQTVDLGAGLSMLIGTGGNLGLLTGPDGAFMIDDQYATNAQANLEKIHAMVGNAPKFLVNTHWHSDHAGGNAVFQAAGTTVFAHENVRKRLSNEIMGVGRTRQEQPQPKIAWPVITFKEGVDFHLNGQTIHAIKVPAAHTDGDVVLHFVEADVIHTGDTYMKGRFPFIDTGSGGTLDGMIEAQQRVLKIADADTRIIPGHGDLATKADLEETNRTIIAAKAAVQKHVAAKDTLEKTIAAKPLAQWDKTYGAGFITSDQFVTVIYEELTKKK